MERAEREDFFVRVFGKYRGMILMMAYRRTRDYELAQDICQQAALSAWLHLELFAGLETEQRKAWLLRVTGNLIRDHWRKPSTRCENILEEDQFASVSGQRFGEWLPDHIEYQMGCETLLRRIFQEAHSANEDWYRLMDLLFIEECTQEEAARILDISIEILRARLYRARKFIRKHFGEEYRYLADGE